MVKLLIIPMFLFMFGCGPVQVEPTKPVQVLISFDLTNIQNYFKGQCETELKPTDYASGTLYDVAVEQCTDANVAGFLQAFSSIFGTPTPTPTPTP